MTRKSSFFHAKRYKNGSLSHVVTGVYRLNPRTGLLLCAGTVYISDKMYRSSSWNRKMHLEQAQARFINSPHKIQFEKGINISSDDKIAYFQFRRMEKFIRYVFSMYGIQASEKLVMLSLNFRDTIAEQQSKIFTEELTRAEQRILRQHLESQNEEYEADEDEKMSDIENNSNDGNDGNDGNGSNGSNGSNDGNASNSNGNDDHYDLCSFIGDSVIWTLFFFLIAILFAYLNNLLTEEMVMDFIISIQK